VFHTWNIGLDAPHQRFNKYIHPILGWHKLN